MKFRVILTSIAAAILLAVGGFAFADVNYTQGAGTVIYDFVCFTTKHCPAHVPISATGNAVTGDTGSAVPAGATYLGLTNAGTLTGWPGDATNGAWVNVKAATGIAQDSTTSGQTGSLVMGAVTAAAPTYVDTHTNALSLTLEGRARVGFMAGSTGGATPYHLVAAATNNSTNLKASAGTVYGVQVGGVGAAPAYLKLYDKATAPTCGTDVPVAQFIIPAASTAANGGGSNVAIPVGKAFANGIGICVVTGIADNDNTAVAAATFIVNIDYK